MEGESTNFLFPVPNDDTKPGATLRRGRGGFRPGSGRKPKPKPCVSCVELLKILHETSSPGTITVLFMEAAAGDINALRRLLELYWQAEKIGLENTRNGA